jgi:hypothetical protein
MTEKRKIGLFIAALIVAAAIAGPVMAADNSQTLPSGDPDARQVLTLIDQARAGTVSRQEYLTAMNNQYTKLVATRDSVLDSSDVMPPKPRTSSSPHK